MTDEKVKACAQEATPSDEPGPFSQLVEQEWQVLLDMERASNRPDMCLLTRTELAGAMSEAFFAGTDASRRALQAERDKLSAKLTALVEACQPFVNWAADNVEPDLQGPGFGIWSGNRCERERIVDWFGPSDFYDLVQALAHHSAPVDPFGCSQGSEAWPDSTPTSAHVEDGEDVALHEWLDEQGASRGEDNGDGFAPYSLLGRVRDLFDRSNPPQEERSDPLDLAAADDNHKALVEACRPFSNAYDRVLFFDDPHQTGHMDGAPLYAYPEDQALRELLDGEENGARPLTVGDLLKVKAALAAFQSRKEEKQP